MCLQETKLASSDDIDAFTLPGYNHFSIGHSISNAGGLLVYIRDDLKIEMLKTMHSNWLWEGLFCRIAVDNKNVVLGNVYINTNAPRRYSDLDIFITEIQRIFHTYNKNGSEFIITGDFNMNLLKLHEYALHDKFYNIMTSLGLLTILQP